MIAPADPGAPPLIELDRATVCRGSVPVLHSLSMRIATGQHTVVLGPNGCGKSTLVKLVTRELYPVARDGAAAVRVLGRSRWDVFALRAQLGVVAPDLQRDLLRAPGLTGEDAVLSGFFAAQRVPADGVTAAMRERAAAALTECDAEHLAARPIAELSTGEARRVLIARAIAHRPQALLLDEPTTGLDPQATRELYRIVGELRADGRCVLVSSHLLAELEPHIDGALILRQGKLLAAGSLHALGEQAALPAQVLLRTHEQAMPELLARLETGGLSAQPRPDGRLELQVPRASKLRMLRELLADPAIVDLDVREPTLAQLYDWLGAGPPSTAEVAA